MLCSTRDLSQYEDESPLLPDPEGTEFISLTKYTSPSCSTKETDSPKVGF